MPALERYTGVLYDALDAGSFDDSEWAVAADAVAVQSALLGLVGAADARAGVPAVLRLAPVAEAR